MIDLQNKTAVITGGGSGLGRELALSCARRGMNVALCDVDAAGMVETEQLIQTQTPDARCLTAAVDVSKLQAVEAFADQVFAQFGSVYLVCNNAGVGVGGSLWDNTEHDWRWVLGVNLEGVAWGIKAFTPRMLAHGEGHIVNTASAAGFIHAGGLGIYNATKAAVVAISETLAEDLRGAGGQLGVSVVCPFFFRTGIADAGRNRPTELSNTRTDPGTGHKERDEAMRRAMDESPVNASDVAELTLEAVCQKRFYVFPHANIKQVINKRFEAVMAETNPPHIR